MSFTQKKALKARIIGLMPKLLMALLLCLAFFVYDRLYKAPSYRVPPSAFTVPNDPYAVPSYNLFMKAEDYSFLFSHKPPSLSVYQPADLYSHQSPIKQKAKVRVRGSHAWHWHPEKPSLRLRVLQQDGEPYYLDLISPEDPAAISNPLATMLAAKLSLPYYMSSLCQLSLNNQPMGIYNVQHTTASNHAMVRNHSAITMVTGNSWSIDIWKNPRAWQFTPMSGTASSDPAVLSAQTASATSCIAKMLKLFSWPMNPANAALLGEHLDLKALAEWSAYQTCIGGIHTDDFHNNFYILNERGKLVPIISDPAAFGALTALAGQNTPADQQLPIYEFLTPVLDLAFRDPRFQYERNLALHKLLTGPFAPEQVAQYIDSYLKALAPLYFREGPTSALVTVPVLQVPMRLPVSVQQRIRDVHRIKDFYQKRTAYVMEQLSLCEAQLVRVSQEEEIALNKNRFNNEERLYRLSLYGHAPLSMGLEGLKVKLFNSLEDEWKECARDTLLYPSLSEAPAVKENTKWLLIHKTNGRLAKYVLEPEVKHYYLAVKKDQEKRFLEQLQSACKNAITNERVGLRIL